MGVILGWIVNFMFTLEWNETSTQIIAFPHNFMIGVRLEVQDVRELHPVVELHVLAGLHVKSEPLEM